MNKSVSLDKKVKGAALIEYAIVLPLLLMLIVGVLELSLFFIQDNTLNKSVRESSRFLSRNIGLQGCYTVIAEQVVEQNINNLFNSGFATFNSLNGQYRAWAVCVNETSGAVSSPIRIDDSPSCSSFDSSCPSGTHLHVQVTASIQPRMVTPLRAIPGWANLNFTPTLSATSIMRVQ